MTKDVKCSAVYLPLNHWVSHSEDDHNGEEKEEEKEQEMRENGRIKECHREGKV